MKKIFFIIVFVLAFIGISFAIGHVVTGSNDNEITEVANVSNSRSEIMMDKYFYPNNFYNSVEQATVSDVKFQTDIVRAGIIPHDITQGQMIAHFFQGLINQNPKRIILLGPNHYEVGNSKFITTTADWETEFGIVKTDDRVVENLLVNYQFSENSKIIENEHSVSAIVPYISNYLPNTQVVPIIFKADIRENEIEAVIKIIDDYIDDETVVVAAVDFSHYLTKAQASINDEKTKNYLENLDYQSILNLGGNFNDYLDSPAVIGLLLKWLDNKGYINSQFLSHVNSADEANDPNIQTTSYFELIYY
ncbi:MAG: AmmeMemoRadiSam system protein B [Candidatus Kerfeldbacteria bacterium]